MIWDMKTVRAVQALRSWCRTTVYDLENGGIPRRAYIDHMRTRAARELADAAATYGVDIDADDVKYWEEPVSETDELGDSITYLKVGARWFQLTCGVELVGGPNDGERMILKQGAIGQVLYVPMAGYDYPIWDTGDGPPPVADLRKFAYHLSGWNDKSRLWVYSPGQK